LGQGFSHLGGGADIRKTINSDIDFRIRRQLKGWGKADDPPSIVKLIQLVILYTTISVVFTANSSKEQKPLSPWPSSPFYITFDRESIRKPPTMMPYSTSDMYNFGLGTVSSAQLPLA
jgi:hypothetical protein